MSENALAEEQEIPEAPVEEAPEVETAEAPEEQPEESAEPPKRNAAEERIQQLVAERNAAMEFGRYWQERARGEAPKPEAPKEEPAPKVEDFDGDTAKWADAYAEWSDKRIEQRAAKIVEQQIGRVREADTQEQMRAQYNERVQAFSAQHPDYSTVISNPSLPITSHMSEVIMASEKGPDIAYHLGNNPTEAARIARLSPTQQAAALGRLEASLEKSPPPKPASRAPAPPTPIRGSAPSSINLETCDIRDYIAARLNK